MSAQRSTNIMMESIQDFHLTRLSRLLRAWQVICALIAVFCWALFGWFKVVLLCAVCGLSYCSASYLYYNPEAKQWREQVDRWYEIIFVWALSYRHTPHLQTAVEPSISQQQQSSDSNPRNSGKPQPSKSCHREAQKMIQLIMQHFVHKWYDELTNDIEFPEDVQKILEHVALETNIRLKQIDLEEIVCEIAALVIPYLDAVNEAGEQDHNGVKAFDVTHEKCVREFESNALVEHRALRSREQELRYYRQAIDALIQCAVPNEYAGCDSACMFVREVLLENVIEPVLNLLCDPDFLYKSIPIVLSKASEEKVVRELAEIQRENEKLEKDLSRGRLIVKMQGQQRIRFHSLSNRFGHSFNEGSPLPGQHPNPKTSPLVRPMSMAGVPSAAYGRGMPHSWRSSVLDPRELTYGLPGNTEPQDDAMPSQVSPRPQHGSPHLRSVPVATALPAEFTAVGIDVWEDDYDDMGCEEVESVDSETDIIIVNVAPIYIERHVRVVSGSGTSSHIAYVFKVKKITPLHSRLLWYVQYVVVRSY